LGWGGVIGVVVDVTGGETASLSWKLPHFHEVNEPALGWGEFHSQEGRVLFSIRKYSLSLPSLRVEDDRIRARPVIHW